jgi:hypothetical protein
MKKARIMLSIMIVIGVLGGIVAFRATRFNSTPALTSTSVFTIGSVVYATTTKHCIHLGIFATPFGEEIQNTFTTDGVIQGGVLFRGSNGVWITKYTYICNPVVTFTTNLP